LAGNLVKPLLSLYGTEWRERGYGLWKIHTYADVQQSTNQIIQTKQENSLLPQVKFQSENMNTNNKSQLSGNIQKKTRKCPIHK
jgi:hypothetical protein